MSGRLPAVKGAEVVRALCAAGPQRYPTVIVPPLSDIGRQVQGAVISPT